MDRSKLSQSRLKEALTYNKVTGVFTWNTRPLHHFKNTRSQNSWNSKHAGKIAGKFTDRYVQISVDKKRYLAHRLAFLFVNGSFPENVVDHIDGVTKNNAWENIRDVTKSGNSQNQTKVAKHNKYCTMLGVSYLPKWNKYLARIVIKKKNIRIGLFNSEQDAHNAYVEAKRRLHPTCTI